MQKSLQKRVKTAPTKAPKTAPMTKPIKSRAFKSTKTVLNSRRDKFAESVLNIIPPKKTAHSLLSTIPVSQAGDVLPTGAKLAPVRNKSNRDGYDITKVRNTIPLPKHKNDKTFSFSKQQIANRRLFFNTFPRSSASPAGHILQTQYTNYSVYRGVIDYSKRLPGVDIKISVKERVDYTDRYDSRWYAEAMARPRARVEMNIKHFKFLTQLERDLLGEILGPRYNWQNGKIIVSIGNLREIHASINRCFQLVHEAAFRAIEIAPHIQAQADIENAQYKSQVALAEAEEIKVNAALKAMPAGQLHFTRATKPLQQFLTTDNQHYIPFNPEFTIEDHLPYIPHITLENMLLADTIPPGMAKPLQRRKDFDHDALAADPNLDPEQIVSPGLEPYSYMSRARLVAAMSPQLTREFEERELDENFDSEWEFAPDTPSRVDQMLEVMDSEYAPESSDLEAFAAGAVMEGQVHPLDMAKALHQLKVERDLGDINLDFLISDEEADPDADERWKETQFAPR